jgi:hypothetical protein
MVRLMIASLSVPLSLTEIKGGWDERKRSDWLQYYQGLLRTIENEGEVHLQDFIIGRYMDMDGIISGDLRTHAARIAISIKGVVGWTRQSTNESRKLSWPHPGQGEVKSSSA